MAEVGCNICGATAEVTGRGLPQGWIFISGEGKVTVGPDAPADTINVQVAGLFDRQACFERWLNSLVRHALDAGLNPD